MLEKDRVVAFDGAAHSAGIVPGMRRGGVLTLVPDAVIRERDLTREAELVRGVAFALLQFTPHVVLAEESVVLADVSASLRLFGGIRPLRRRARHRKCMNGSRCLPPSVRGSSCPTGSSTQKPCCSRRGA
ncbi:hypothetical protein R69658_08229 [Paraburkholderia aspalathi]|uniref:Uncharacterized protein n=1 Tax=Paraburkholderia aspalathi TaxID=1324617 RepID=A0ABM8T944_9BURK|nr:hypothetical protein R69658_08229 [Paraburkholderia aspalathi]